MSYNLSKAEKGAERLDDRLALYFSSSSIDRTCQLGITGDKKFLTINTMRTRILSFIIFNFLDNSPRPILKSNIHSQGIKTRATCMRELGAVIGSVPQNNL